MEDPLDYPPYVQRIPELATATGIQEEALFSGFADEPRSGLEITDTNDEGDLNFDLYDLLDTIGEDTVLGWHWVCRSVEASGPGAGALHAADEDGLVLSGETMFDLATNVDQTIEGLFLALVPGEPEPILVLRVVDNSWWEVWTAADEIHQAMLGRFERAQFID